MTSEVQKKKEKKSDFKEGSFSKVACQKALLHAEL